MKRNFDVLTSSWISVSGLVQDSVRDIERPQKYPKLVKSVPAQMVHSNSISPRKVFSEEKSVNECRNSLPLENSDRSSGIDLPKICHKRQLNLPLR